MQIKAIYEVTSNRDWYNFRIKPLLKDNKPWEVMNIKTYKKCENAKQLHEELKNWFKYWYDSRIGEWKHHKWLKTSFFHEF